jgi:hypothetical protein
MRTVYFGSFFCLFFSVAASAFPLIKDTDVSLEGNMSRNGSDPASVWLDQALRGQPTFGSSGQPSLSGGKFTTPVFRAPATLEMYMSGFPSHKGNRIYLRDEQFPTRTIDLVSEIDPGPFWRLRVWEISPAWRNVQVRLIVEDASPGIDSNWLAFTLPSPAHATYLYELARAGWRAVLVCFAALAFLLPGLAVAFIVNRYIALEPVRMAIVVLVAAGLLGYFVFWFYFMSAGAGQIVSILAEFDACCVCVFFIGGARKTGQRRLPGAVMAVLAATVLVAIFYSSLGFVYLSDDNVGAAMQRRFFTYSLPPDNVLPEMVAERLYRDESLRPPLLSGWQTSDRPPLQAGLVLMQYPVWRVITPDLVYQLISIFLQCCWLASVWVLLRSAGLSYRRMLPVLALCLFSGFCFLHSVYVWPKLLAAAFCLMGLSMFVTPTGLSVKLSRWEWMLAGLCFGLSLLSHSGSSFTIAGIFIVLAFQRKDVVWRHAIPGLACLVILILPWVMFQKLYDPPGDQLIKLSLTGEMNRDLSLVQALGKAYHGMTIGEFAHRRWEDIKILFYHDAIDLLPARNLREYLDHFTREQFYTFFSAIGIVNLGFLLRLFRPRKNLPGAFKVPDQLVSIVLISLPIWILLMSEARATVIHAGSLANLLLMLVAGGLYLATVFPRGVYVVIAIQAILIFPLTVFSRPALQPETHLIYDIVLDPGMLSIAFLALATLAVMSWLAVNRMAANRTTTPAEVTN